MTKAGRAQLPRSAYGDPDRRLYPITSQSDVMAAAHLIGKAPPNRRAAIKARIISIAKSHGWTIPAAWQTDTKS
jgi:hypothetical protein